MKPAANQFLQRQVQSGHEAGPSDKTTAEPLPKYPKNGKSVKEHETRLKYRTFTQRRRSTLYPVPCIGFLSSSTGRCWHLSEWWWCWRSAEQPKPSLGTLLVRATTSSCPVPQSKTVQACSQFAGYGTASKRNGGKNILKKKKSKARDFGEGHPLSISVKDRVTALSSQWFQEISIVQKVLHSIDPPFLPSKVACYRACGSSPPPGRESAAAGTQLHWRCWICMHCCTGRATGHYGDNRDSTTSLISQHRGRDRGCICKLFRVRGVTRVGVSLSW